MPIIKPVQPPKLTCVSTFWALLWLLALVLQAASSDAQTTDQVRQTAVTSYTLGVYTDNYPYSFINDRGELDGFSNDLSHAIEKCMPEIRFKRSTGTTGEVNARQKAGEIDVLQTLAESEERKALFLFSKPYLSLVNSIIVRKGETRVRSPEDLSKVKVMVHRGSLGEAYLIKHNLKDRISYRSSVEYALRALDDGNGEALIATRLTAISTAVRLHLDNVDRTGIPIPELLVPYCYAICNKDEKLRATIDEGLAILNRNGDFERIYQKWFGHIEPSRFSVEEIMGAVSIGLSIALIIAIWAVLRQRRLQAAIVSQAEALRSSEERYRSLFESSLEAMIHLGPFPSLAIQQINSSALNLLRIDTLPPTFTPLLSTLPANVAERLSPALVDACSPANSNRFELELPFPDSSVWVNGSISKIAENYLLVLNDITETHRAHEQLLKSEQQQRQAQKLEAIGTLASGIAHDFNNILTAIIGNAELASLDLEPDDKLAPHISEVLLSAQRARLLVHQILTFSRRSESKREVLRCTPIVAEAVNFIRATAPASIQIKHTPLVDGPEVEVDPTQLHQVIMNLCTNGLHAMRSMNGQLEVNEDLVDITTEMIAVHPQLRLGRFLRISVRDTGCGMPAHVLQRIFEPFFTTKSPGEGTGLGLSVVHGIIQAHKGALTVYSQPGQGTIFRIHLPITNEHPTTAHKTAPQEVPLGNGQRILFVDDEAAIVRIAGELLRHLKYSPLCFTNPHEAAEAFAENPGGFDMLITDLTMPGLGGIELCRRVRQLRPQLPVILASGFLGESDARQAAETSIHTFVQKPLSLVILGEATHAEFTRVQGDAMPQPAQGQ